MSDDVLDTWNATTDSELTLTLVDSYFSELWDDLYKASAAIDRVVDDVSLQRVLLDKVLAATDSAVERGKSIFSTAILVEEAADEGREEEDKGEGPSTSKPTIGSPDERTMRLLALRSIAIQRLKLVETYVEMSKDPEWTSSRSNGSAPAQTEDEDEDEADPWGEEDLDMGDETTSPPATAPTPPLSLSELLTLDLLSTTLQLIEHSRFSAVQTLMSRHLDVLYSHRLDILSAIPSFTPPQEYTSLIPSLDYNTGQEKTHSPMSPLEGSDWVQTPEAKEMYHRMLETDYAELTLTNSFPVGSHPAPLSVTELSAWYIERTKDIDGQMGLTDVALELVQHGASQGIPGLDEIGEELSLLARLVYDTPGASDAKADAKTWSLERWKSLSEMDVIRGYLSRSTPSTIPNDIRRLVMPYLYVLEARAERAGKPDPELPSRLLHSYILSAPLELCLPVFSSSKPILKDAQRIIKNDEVLARLALAKLYGSKELDAWTTMSGIFECLPDWPAPSPETTEDGELEADTTLTSLTAFVQPRSSRADSAPPEDLFMFFSPLHSAALSRALDILDVHLECGEIMARWGVSAPLAWFLQSSEDERQQRAWATRMARQATVVDDGVSSQAAYTELLNDMLRLVGPADQKARGAFRLLGRAEVTKIFLSGLLSAGKFDVAKKFLSNPSVRKLHSRAIEELCLSASREFYDNASTGNLHVGDMKLAYDCLSVCPSTEKIRSERLFIEATSRICSFNVTSPSGLPITPLEIRLTPNRLSLVARILSESDDAYKYPDIILELVHKLGFKKGDVPSEVKVRAMLADSALGNEDFERAVECVEKMVSLLKNAKPLQSSSSASLTPTPLPALNGHSQTDTSAPDAMIEAIEVCWRSCFQLGRQGEFNDTKAKLKLLGHALQLCPPENTIDILSVWRRLESEDIEDRKSHPRGKTGLATKTKPSSTASSHRNGFGGKSLSERSASLFSTHLSDYAPSSEHLLHQGADAALLAKQTISRVAANFPFDLRPLRNGIVRPGSAASGRSDDASSVRSGGARSGTPDVSSQARQALSRGMGWLIGDDS